MSWRLCRFSDVLEMNRRPYTLGPAEDADLVGMRLYGIGPFHREKKPAHLIRKKSHFVIRSGDVIYNKLFAWKGTFGIVPEEFDGMFVSDKFPTYELDTAEVYPPYLAQYFRLPKLWNYAKRYSKGSAALSKLTLNPPQFLELPLLLPELELQKNIANTLTNAFVRLDETWNIRDRPSLPLFGRSVSVAQEGRLLLHSALSRLGEVFCDRPGTLGEILVDTLRAGPSFPVASEGGGIPVVMPSCVGSFRYNSQRILYGVYDASVPEKDLLQPGDLLFSRGNKTDHVGTCAVFPGHGSPITYANLFMRVRIAPSDYDVNFLQYWLMTPYVRKHVRANTKGTSPTVQKINSTGVKSIPFPVGVSMDEQCAWIEKLDRIRGICDEIESTLENSAEKLKLLPHAITNHVFRDPWAQLVE